MSTPSFKELSLVPSFDVSALIVAALHIQGYLIPRPTMFPLKLEVALLESLLTSSMVISAGLVLLSILT